MSADDVRVACPLFQAEYGGSIPTSALQLHITPMDIHEVLRLNRLWHSRLPELTNWQACIGFGAQFSNVFYAVAIWGPPVARAFNGKNYLELRRMAIADDAPKNTASRMISIMRKWIQREMPEIVKLISYQDTEVHNGTIYKASGWTPSSKSKYVTWTNNTRIRNKEQATGDKICWEYNLK